MKHFWYRDGVRAGWLALPPKWALAFVGCAYLVLEIVQYPGSPRMAWDSKFFQIQQSLLVCVAAAVFGAYRVIAFHPYLRLAYREWLVRAGWRTGKALPLGPLALAWSDGLLLLAGMGLVWHADSFISPFAVPALFAAAYFLFAVYTLVREGPRPYAYAVAAGLGAMLMFDDRPEIACLVAVSTYWTAWLGLRRSLAGLPEFEPGWLEKLLAIALLPPVTRTQFFPTSAGWPFGRLNPKRSPRQLPRWDAACIAVLVGWLIYCVVTQYNHIADSRPKAEEEADRLIGMSMLSVLALIRLFVYVGACRPPLSFLGRIATGRLLIPSYDRVLAAPVASLIAIWWVGPQLAAWLGLPPTAVQLPLIATLALLAVLLPGPSYADWILTSECRILPTRLESDVVPISKPR